MFVDRVEFLNEVCAQVRAKSVHSAIREELSSHIDEIKDEEIQAGLPPEEAERKALLYMGSPEDIGLQLDKKHRPMIEWTLLLITVAIAAMGVLVAFVVGEFDRKAAFTLLGLAVMTGVMFFNYTWLKKHPVAVYLVFCGLLLLLAFIQYRSYIRTSMLHIGYFAISSPVAQLGQLAPILLAGIIASDERLSVAKLAIIAAISALPIVVVGKSGYAILLTLAYIIIFSVLAAKGDRNGRFLLAVPAAAVVLEAIMIATHQYMLDRITVFLSGGQSDPLAAGYLNVQLINVVKNANLFGAANSSFDFLRMGGSSEFLLVGILGRFGWIPTIAIILLVAALIWRIFSAAGRIRNRYGFVLSLSGCSILTVKFIYYILMNFGFLPIIGIALPIIGGGGTDCIITMAILGLILSVYRRNNLISDFAEDNKGDPAQFWHHVVDIVFGK